jgi:hypothetical protein
MLVTITNEQKVELVLAPVTAAGNPATVDGVPTWEVVSGDATLEVAENGLSCFLVSGEANVNSVITVTADADLGEGVSAITDTIDLAVVAASASSLGLTANAPVIK